MPRTERDPSIVIAFEPNSKHRCRCRVTLGRSDYLCARSVNHGGAHDANITHSDGYLVRW